MKKNEKSIVKGGANSASITSMNTSASKSKTSTTSENTPLSKEEKAALDTCLATITKGLSSYIEIGAAFKEIKEKQLHRAEALRFYEYCVKLLGLSKAHVNRSIKASECAQHIQASAPNGAAVPRNEGSARVIAGLTSEEQLKVATLVKNTVGDAIPTAEDFKKAKVELLPPKAKAPAQTNRVVLHMKEKMGLNELNEAVTWAEHLAEKYNADEELRTTLADAVAIVADFLLQLAAPDEELPAVNPQTSNQEPL